MNFFDALCKVVQRTNQPPHILKNEAYSELSLGWTGLVVLKHFINRCHASSCFEIHGLRPWIVYFSVRQHLQRNPVAITGSNQGQRQVQRFATRKLQEICSRKSSNISCFLEILRAPRRSWSKVRWRCYSFEDIRLSWSEGRHQLLVEECLEGRCLHSIHKRSGAHHR